MSVKIGAELIHIVGEMVALRFELPTLTEGTEVESDSLYAMFAIDKSGSMSGGPMNDAKGAAESLVTKFRNGDIPCTVYPFDSRHKEHHSETEGYDKLVELIKALHASGGTIFANVMNAMKQRIEDKSLKNIFCVWLTDGQDNNGINTLTPIMEQQKAYFENNGISIAIHCIGFSSGHDANLLTKLSQSGTRPGTFQYVPEGGRIPVAVNNIYTLAFESSTWARFIGGESSYKVIIESEGSGYKALVYVSENDLEDCKVEIHKGSQVQVAEIEPTRGDYRSIEDIVHLVTAFVASKIANALEKGIAGALEKLTELGGLIEEAERRLGGLYQDCNTLRPYKRKQLAPFFVATNELIDSFKKIITSRNLDNVQFANINGMASRLFLKRNLEKKIAKEAGDNVRLLFESDEKVNQVMKDIDIKAIEEKHAGYLATRNLKCGLSNENWVSLLSHGDCLCVTLFLERPQNLVGIAYEIKVKNVNYLLVSHDNFLNSKLFETKAGQIIQGDRSYAHGTIPPKANELIPGLPQETVNGILPLYINEDHWKIASLRMSQMVGYNTTVDVLGFNQDQLIVFPYLAYAKALEQNSELLIELLRDTCDQVYKENKEKILPVIHELIEKYLTDPMYRVAIKDLSVVLGWLSSAVRSGDVTEYKHLLPHILEEEIRRNFTFTPIVRITELAVKYLGIDINPHFEEVRANLMKGGVSYAEHFKSALRVKLSTQTEEKVEVKEEKKEEAKEDNKEQVKVEGEIKEEVFKFAGRIEKLSEEVTLNIDNINSAFMADGSLFKFVQLFKELNFPVKTLEDLNFVELEQKLSFVLQALGHKKDRKEAVEWGLYTNSFAVEESVKFVQNLYSASVNKEVLAYRSKLVAELSSNEGSKKAVIFAMTADLEEAAGCLYGVSQGVASFPLYYKALMTKGVVEIVEKVKMLTLGNYKGVKLIFDSVKSGSGFVLWKPKKKTVHKIWALYKDEVPKEKWQEAFPHKFDHFEHVYLRISGNFVAYSKPRKNVKDPRHWEGKPAPGAAHAHKSGKKKGRGGKGGRGGRRGRP